MAGVPAAIAVVAATLEEVRVAKVVAVAWAALVVRVVMQAAKVEPTVATEVRAAAAGHVAARCCTPHAYRIRGRSH